MEGEVSEFSGSFGLQSHPLPLTASLCPTGGVSQAWACTIYGLVSLDLARVRVSLPPWYVGCTSVLLGLWTPQGQVVTVTSVVTCCRKLRRGPTATSKPCLKFTGTEGGQESPTFGLPSAYSCYGLLQPARLLLCLSCSMSLNA